MLQTEIELRDYQKDVIRKLYAEYRKGLKSVVMVLPTGAGKTVIAAQIIKDAVGRGRRILFMVHMDALVPQTYDKLLKLGIESSQIGFIKAGYPENREARIQIASLQTLARREWWKEVLFDVLLFDECHQTSFFNVGRKVRETFPEAFVVGLTATPWRLKPEESLKTEFQSLVHGPLPRDLQQMGMLATMDYYSCYVPDLSQIKLDETGDFDTEELGLIYNTPELIRHAYDEWERLGGGKQTISFCLTVEHAEALCDYFQSMGVMSSLITADVSQRDRRNIYDLFERGIIKVISSVNCLSIGFDSPRAEVGLMLRPTCSKALFHQQIGRVMRPHADKAGGIILDFTGNIKRHQLPELIKGYALVDPQEKEEKPAPYKKCPSCFTWVPLATEQCPECGHHFAGNQEMKAAAEVIYLTKVDLERLKDAPKVFYQSNLRRAYQEGKQPYWAVHRFNEKYGYRPLGKGWERGAVFDGKQTEQDIVDFAMYLLSLTTRKTYQPKFVFRDFRREFGKDVPFPTHILPF